MERITKTERMNSKHNDIIDGEIEKPKLIRCNATNFNSNNFNDNNTIENINDNKPRSPTITEILQKYHNFRQK